MKREIRRKVFYDGYYSAIGQLQEFTKNMEEKDVISISDSAYILGVMNIVLYYWSDKEEEQFCTKLD